MRSIFLLFAFCFLLVTTALPTSADLSIGNGSSIQGLAPFNPINTDDASDQLASLISIAIGAVTIISGLSFLFYFLMGALGWLTSGGDKQKLENSRDRITTAMIGLVLVVAAYALTGIVGRLFGLDILDIKSTINKIIVPSGVGSNTESAGDNGTGQDTGTADDNGTGQDTGNPDNGDTGSDTGNPDGSGTAPDTGTPQ